jgi:hypothetical protein
MALNIIYSTGAQTNETPYWFFLGISELIANPRADVNFRDSHLGSTFSGQSKDALVVLFTPGSHECLHLVRKSDANYRGYSDSLRLIAPFTSLDSIDTEVSEDKSVGSLNFRLLNQYLRQLLARNRQKSRVDSA